MSLESHPLRVLNQDYLIYTNYWKPLYIPTPEYGLRKLLETSIYSYTWIWFKKTIGNPYIPTPKYGLWKPLYIPTPEYGLRKLLKTRIYSYTWIWFKKTPIYSYTWIWFKKTPIYSYTSIWFKKTPDEWVLFLHEFSACFCACGLVFCTHAKYLN